MPEALKNLLLVMASRGILTEQWLVRFPIRAPQSPSATLFSESYVHTYPCLAWGGILYTRKYLSHEHLIMGIVQEEERTRHVLVVPASVPVIP